MTERIIIAAAINILTWLALAVIFVVGADDVFQAIPLVIGCLVGASTVLAKVEPRGEILCYVTVALFYFNSAVQRLLNAEIWSSMLSCCMVLAVLHWAYLQNLTQDKEFARTFFYRVTWFVFGLALLMAIVGVIILIVLATNVVNGSAGIEKDDIVDGLCTICFVVLAVSNWFVAMEDPIPISSQDNSDENKKDEELQTYESMT